VEHEGSLSCSYDPNTGQYPASVKCSPSAQTHSPLRSSLIYVLLPYTSASPRLFTFRDKNVVRIYPRDTRYRSWLSHYATSRKVAGSILDEVDIFQ
jgi:hypothetical protein